MINARRLRVLGAGLALALSATACGGGGETTSPAGDATDTAVDTTETETQTETQTETETEGATEQAASQDFGGPLRVVLSSRFNLPLIGADAAQHLGIFEDMGLEVDLVESQDTVAALASGDADIAVASPNRFVGGILAGLEATIVGPTIDVWDQFWIVRADMDVDTLEEFPGGKIGVSRIGSAGHYSAEKVAAELGLSEDDYEIVTMGSLDGLIAGLANGTIDAFAWSAQAALTLEQAGEGKVLGHVSEIMGPNPLDVIAVANSTIEDRPEAVSAFCDAFYQAQQTFKEDIDLAEKTFVEEWEFDPEIARPMILASAKYLSTSDEISQEQFANMADATEFTIEDVGDVTGEQVAEMYTPCSEL